jgi:hypothetical protein
MEKSLVIETSIETQIPSEERLSGQTGKDSSGKAGRG